MSPGGTGHTPWLGPGAAMGQPDSLRDITTACLVLGLAEAGERPLLCGLASISRDSDRLRRVGGEGPDRGAEPGMARHGLLQAFHQRHAGEYQTAGWLESSAR
ncbi:uncharacterized protein BDZ99DRAFT_470212 [Mytilinidion resinicola]|uniref:Uncharacterized protein n=1 Tax=Mytilinidion resinicola TaxID=574789 RepID=A0A6A6Z8P0_9PEZI|nr:uncharacterized protein BDZ99DRAFT_470212 [Mytilinidion resinicola]KAF2817168.1 hypothetical protein BDZ99DRAFT_470212 [Mytilinidion resinicola]